jgi:hypothetical protein
MPRQTAGCRGLFDFALSCCNAGLPMVRRLGSKDPERRPRDEVKARVRYTLCCEDPCSRGHPPARGKIVACEGTGLLRCRFRGTVSRQRYRNMRWEENGNDTDDSGRTSNNIKSIYPYHRTKNARHRRRRFSLWALWTSHIRRFRSFYN